MAVDCHTIRFYQVEPRAINYMKCDHEYKLLALARSDNSIEVWNVGWSPVLERVIQGSGGSVQSLAWYQRRLFSVGLQGSVIEYDLFRQCAKSMHPLTSGASRCISIHHDKKLLVAGTDEGYINVLDIGDDEIVYHKLLDKQEGVIICLDWECSGEFVVSGGIDVVRVWNISTGHAVHRMLIGRTAVNIPVTVTCITVTSDFTIISGDTRGKLCMWDGCVGSLTSSYQSHTGPIRALTLSADGNTVYCAGDTAVIATYEKVMVRQDTGSKWIKSVQRFIHDHPVYALASSQQKLFSGGVDSYLVSSWYPPKSMVRFPQIPPGKLASCGGDKYVALRYQTSIEIWKLEGEQTGASKVLQWSTSQTVTAAAISSDAAWLAVSKLDQLVVLRLDLKRAVPQIKKVQLDCSKRSRMAGNVLSISSDNKILVVASFSGEVYVLSLLHENEIDGESKLPSANLMYTLKPHKSKELTDTIHLVSLSSDGSYIALADLQYNIVIYHDGQFWSKTAKYQCPITALAVSPHTLLMVIVYSDHKIIEYNIKKKKITEFCKKLNDLHPKQWLQRSTPVRGVMFDSRNPDIIALHDDSIILVVNKSKEVPEQCSKIPRLETQQTHHHFLEEDESQLYPTITKVPNKAFHVVKRSKHLVHVEALSEGKIFAVELSPLVLSEKLPPRVRQGFGEK